MWHWDARKKSSWTKHSLLQQKVQVFRAIPWLRKCASKKFGPCAEKHLQRGATVNLLPQTEQDDQELPDEVKRSLDGQWEACHGFVLNTFRLLSKTQQNKIYWMSHGAPRAFPIVLLESMRLLCRLSHGKPVKAASSTRDSNMSEEVSGVFELWTRLRAFFTTLAYTSILIKKIRSVLENVNSLLTNFSNGFTFVTVDSGLRFNFTLMLSTVHVLHFSQRSEPTER